MTGCEPLIGRLVDVCTMRGNKRESLQGLTLEAAGAVGVTLRYGDSSVFVLWRDVVLVAAARGSEGPAETEPAPDELKALWGNE